MLYSWVDWNNAFFSSFLQGSFIGYNIFDWQLLFFSFSSLNMVSYEKSAVILIGIPFMSSRLLLLLSRFSLCVIDAMMALIQIPLLLTYLAFLSLLLLVGCFYRLVWEALSHYFSNIFSAFLSLSSPATLILGKLHGIPNFSERC